MTKVTTLAAVACAALIGGFVGAAPSANAEWIQYGENGQITTNIGGAGVASASDIDVWNTNPAGAAKFTTPRIGVSLKALNTTNLDNREPGFPHGISTTVTGSDSAFLPSVGAYVPGLLPNVTVGVGFGTIAALAGDFGNQPGVTTTPANATGQTVFGHNPLGASKVEILTTELSPTVGIKLSDKLNVGASIGFTTVKHLLAEIQVFAPAAVTGGLGPLSTTLRVQTDDNIGLPIPPWEFAATPHEYSYTLGMQYQLLPNVAIGAVYRSESETQYDVNLFLHATNERDKGYIRLDVPRHVQIGATIDVTPTLKVHADVKWTNWSDAAGVGTPFILQIQGDLGTGLAPCLGTPCVNQLISQPMRGDDTYAFRFGAQWRVLPNLELQAGYHYDPAVFDRANLNYVFYSSNRHIFSLGASLDVPDAGLLGTSGDWEFTVGGQIIAYEDITVQPGQSQTFGLGFGALGIPVTSFEPNTQAFEIGGYIWTFGVQAVYKFGALEELALK